MMFTRCASPELQFAGLREGGGTREAETTESLVERSSALWGEYAPNSARAEGSSIVEGPGK